MAWKLFPNPFREKKVHRKCYWCHQTIEVDEFGRLEHHLTRIGIRQRHRVVCQGTGSKVVKGG